MAASSYQYAGRQDASEVTGQPNRNHHPPKTMSAALLLAVQIMSAIPSITTSVQNLLNWVASVRAAARQSGEWTEQHEAAFINALLNRRDTTPYKTDAELGLTPLVPAAIGATA